MGGSVIGMAGCCITGILPVLAAKGLKTLMIVGDAPKRMGETAHDTGRFLPPISRGWLE